MNFKHKIIVSSKRGRTTPDEEERKKLREERRSNGEQFLLREEKMMNGMQRVEGKDIRKRKKEEFCHTQVGKGKLSDYFCVKMENFVATWEEGKEKN